METIWNVLERPETLMPMLKAVKTRVVRTVWKGTIRESAINPEAAALRNKKKKERGIPIK